MQDQPSKYDLIAAATHYIRDTAMPALSGHAGFYGRIAANILDITAREMRFGDRFAAAQTARLHALLNSTEDLPALNRILCKKLATGELDLSDPAVKEHLVKTTMGKLAIDQPHYAGYKKAQSLGWPEEDGMDNA